MPETALFKITGTEAEIQAFIRSLAYEPELTFVSTSPTERGTRSREDEPFGAGELVTFILEFAVAVSAHATYEYVKEVFTRFRGDRRHIELEKAEREEDEDLTPKA